MFLSDGSPASLESLNLPFRTSCKFEGEFEHPLIVLACCRTGERQWDESVFDKCTCTYLVRRCCDQYRLPGTSGANWMRTRLIQLVSSFLPEYSLNHHGRYPSQWDECMQSMQIQFNGLWRSRWNPHLSYTVIWAVECFHNLIVQWLVWRSLH